MGSHASKYGGTNAHNDPASLSSSPASSSSPKPSSSTPSSSSSSSPPSNVTLNNEEVRLRTLGGGRIAAGVSSNRPILDFIGGPVAIAFHHHHHHHHYHHHQPSS